ncbi:uncharacterized protein [Dysidea avara]|uniref:uncharacterized protein n=1 Tax=Dysidea avara TaxID=196820 RepID=UPI00332DD8CF
MAEGASEDAIRAGLLDQLVDWDGSDLKNVYEPISWQIGNIYVALVTAMFIAWVWNMYRKRRGSETVDYKFQRQILEEEGEKQKRTCAVIGGTGVLGNHIVNSLLRSDLYHVYVVSRRIPPKEDRNPQVDAYVRLDVSDYDGFVQLLEGVDSVFYCVCGLPDVYTNDEDVWTVNKRGIENLISACLEKGVKNLVYTSIPNESSDADLRKSGTFLRSKMLAEKTIFQHTKKGEMNVCVVGLGKMYSKEDSSFLGYSHEELKWFPHLSATYNFIDTSRVASLLVNVEQRLHTKCPLLLEYQNEGKKMQLSADFRGSLKDFAEHFNMKRFFGNHSGFTSSLAAHFNKWSITLTGRAPFGTALAPALLEILQSSELKVSPEKDLSVLTKLS